MADKKKSKKEGINFPCGNLEEMLRMMRKLREKGDIDCEAMMKQFMGKEGRNVDFNELKKQFFGNGSEKLDVEEIMEKYWKR